MRIMRIPAYMENHISRLKANEYPGTALHKIIVMVRFSPLGAIFRIRNYSAELFSDDRTDVSDVRWRNVVLLVLVNAHRCWWTTHLWNFESMQSVQKSYKRCWNVETTLQILSVTAPALVVLSRGCGGMSPPPPRKFQNLTFKMVHSGNIGPVNTGPTGQVATALLLSHILSRLP